MRLNNLALFSHEGVTRVRQNQTLVVNGPSALRVEPSYAILTERITITWRDSSGASVTASRIVDRQTVALFFPVPVGRFVCELSTQSHDVAFQVDARGEASWLAVLEFSRDTEDRYLRRRDGIRGLPFKVLLQLAEEARRARNIRVVAVTGSVGKTTTKELIGFGLSDSPGYVTTDSWNFPHELCAQLVLNAPWITHVVLEAAINEDLPELSRALRPEVTVVTHAAAVHTETWRSPSAIARQKLKLAHVDGTAIINADSSALRGAVEGLGHLRYMSYGATRRSDVDLVANEVSAGGFTKTVLLTHCSSQEAADIEVPIGVHEGSVAAAALAISVCRKISPTQAASRLVGFYGVPHRMELLRTRYGMLLDDSYNANPTSFQHFFRHLRRLASQAAVVLVLGHMSELGPESEQAHCDVLQAGAGITDRIVLLGSGWPEQLRMKARYCTSAQSAHDATLELATAGSLIGVKGSWTSRAIEVALQLRRVEPGGPRQWPTD